MNFKIGDKVRRLKSRYNQNWVNVRAHNHKSVFTIIEITPLSIYLDDKAVGWYPGYFELVERKPINLQDWVE